MNNAGVLILDVLTGTRLRMLTTKRKLKMGSLAWSPDGRQLAASASDGRIWRWDAATGRELPALAARPARIERLVFGHVYARDAWKRVLASGGGDGAVRLWDLAHGTLVGTLGGLETPLAFDGRRPLLFTAAEDGGIGDWSVERLPARRLCTLYSFADGGWAVLDPQNRYDVSNPREMPGTYWVVGDRTLPLGQYARGHYMPGLLERLIRSARVSSTAMAHTSGREPSPAAGRVTP